MYMGFSRYTREKFTVTEWKRYMKIRTALLVLLLTFTAIGCGDKSSNQSPKHNPSETTNQEGYENQKLDHAILE